MAHFNFAQIKANIALTKRVLPIVLAKQAENHFTEAFTKGGLDEHKWKNVNRRISGTYEYKYPSKPKASSRTSPILVRTGNLRRKVIRSTKIRTWDLIKLEVDLPYAKIHNEGGDAGRNHASHIEARPFMIHTKTLGNMQEQLIKKEMDKIWDV